MSLPTYTILSAKIPTYSPPMMLFGGGKAESVALVASIVAHPQAYKTSFAGGRKNGRGGMRRLTATTQQIKQPENKKYP